ncbi:hypothetical protein BHE74_00024907 [Ensete ventricosum]|nr:hypothetical protein BHE74_00024907 [Ensete ventricosum]
MDLLNAVLNFVVPPASMIILAFAWPTISFLHALEWFFKTLYRENMENKVVLITGASSAIGEVRLYESLSSKPDCIVECMYQDINFWGNVYPTYVALPYLRQTRGRILVNASMESWLPLPRMSLYAVRILAAKAAVINFYETLRFELKDDVGITIATHGWIGGDVSSGKFMLEEGAEMQWKEEREVSQPPTLENLTVNLASRSPPLYPWKQVPLAGGRQVEEFAKLMVADACRGNAYAKHPSWYDVFLLYRVFAPDILGWAFRLLLSNGDVGAKPTAGGRLLVEASPPRKPIAAVSSASPQRLLSEVE